MKLRVTSTKEDTNMKTIGLLISANDSVLPVYDTTIIHAKEAAKQCIS